MRKVLMIITAILFVLGSCKKDTGVDNVFFDNSVRQKYFYKKGSYWIYRDSISGQLDSFFVSDIHTHIPEVKTFGYQNYEEMSIEITQNPSDTLIKDMIK